MAIEPVSAISNAITKIAEIVSKFIDSSQQKERMEVKLAKRKLKALQVAEEYIFKNKEFYQYLSEVTKNNTFNQEEEKKKLDQFLKELTKLEEKFFKYN